MNAYEDLITSIHKYEHGHEEALDNLQLCFANEVNTANNFYDASYRINRITESTYNDIHYKIKNLYNGYTYYDLFTYIKEETDTNHLYQVIVCNNYYQIFKFKQDDYDNRKIVSEFEMPGKVYSFYSGTLIIVIGRGSKDIDYKELEA